MLHLHWHREVRNTGIWSYRECRCGKRRIVQTGFGGHQPVCRSWVQTGEFMKSPVPSSLIRPSDAARSAMPYPMGEFLMAQKPDPMKVDLDSGVKHADVLSQEEAQEILDGAWESMGETETHLAVRRFHDEPGGPVEAIVIVARGEAARLLSDFTPSIPSFREEA